MFSYILSGKIITTETISLPYNKSDGILVDATLTHWSESPNKSRSYIRFLRVFCLIATEHFGTEAIGKNEMK